VDCSGNAARKQCDIYFFISPEASFAYSGPAKSIPTLENGGALVTRNSGSAAVAGSLYDLPISLLQVTH
jgi:hypothetical protein